MSPLLLPPRDGRHECEPPMYAVRVPSPDGRPLGPAPLVTRDDRRPALPPAVGSTWDCPVCGRVWVVTDAPLRHYRYGYAAGGRRWIVASTRRARQHRHRIEHGAHRLSGMTAAQIDATDDD